MAEIVRSGAWDLIGAARPSIADPFLPRKIEEGRYGEVRECIGCNVCMLKSERPPPRLHAERDRRRGVPARLAPRALRAGGERASATSWSSAPARPGMECAIVLGKRGFRRVHLVEAEPEVGGIMRWVPRLPGLGEWGRVVNWRAVQLDQLANVEVITGARLERRTCASTGPSSSSSRRARAGRPTGSNASPTSRSPARTPLFRTS